LSLAEGKLIEADNAFALKLFREINRQEGDTNIFVSPLSIAMALGMTYNGAAGTTQQAMQHVLELQGMSIEEVNQSYRDLIDLLRELDPMVEFLLANSIWYRNTITFEQAFLDINQQFFDAEVRALDFSDPGASGIINGWVNENTKGRIPTIVPEVIPADIIMYLINAIYFKAQWASQFDESLTTAGPFTLKSGFQISTDMMWHSEAASIGYYREAGLTVVDLPYGGRAFSMTILLPDSHDGIDALLDEITGANWSLWTGSIDSTARVVSLPKFTLEYKLTMDDVLKSLGMGVAFCNPGPADFTKLRPGGDACISYVDHKAFVEVNEEGTEAAAATVVAIGESAAPMDVLVDRPFVFVIREKFSGTILFMGKIMNPGER
jgi:serpin B